MKKLALLLFLSFISPTSYALSIVVKEEAPYIGSQLLNQGLSIEIVNTVFQRAGIKPTIIFETWPRAYEGGVIGIYDVIGSIWKTKERETDLVFSQPYLFHELKFIKRKNNTNIQFTQLSDINGLIVGVLKDYVYRDDFNKSRKILKLPQNHLIQNLIFLNESKVDITLGDIRKINYEINTYMHSTDNLQILPQALATKSVHIAVSRSNPNHTEIINTFNLGLQKIKADGTYDAILKKHGTLYKKVPVQ